MRRLQLRQVLPVVVIVGMPSGNGRYLRIRDGRCRREPDIVDRAVDVAFGRIAGLHSSLGKARFCPLCCHCKPSFKKAGARALRRPRLAVRLRQLDRAQEPPRNISMLKDRDG
jgi:hypothetical protein